MNIVPCIVLQTLIYLSVAVSAKVDHKLLSTFEHRQGVSVIVECRDVSEIHEGASVMSEALGNIQTLVESRDVNTRTQSGGHILNKLIDQQQGITKSSLKPVTRILDKHNVNYKILWTSSVVHIPSATLPVIQELAKLNVVKSIRKRTRFHLLIKSIARSQKMFSVSNSKSSNSPWYLKLINARCKNITCLGEGVVYGGIDTGVLWNHHELKDNFRHDNYSWWNPVNPGDSPFPSDDEGHGTFTTGNAVGKTVGVAPKAKWIACKACIVDQGCYDSDILECMEYMACPWRWDDTSEDKVTKNASKRPHVVNMSLGGYGGSQLMHPSFEPMFKALAYMNKLGIVTTISAGNEGPGCGTIGWPSSFSNAMSVGSVDENATISYFSSRGPVISANPPDEHSISVEGATVIEPPALKGCTNSTLAAGQIYEILKPDIVAPGSNINGSWGSGVGDYIVASGTSAAAPLVAGVMVLVICTNTSYPWNYKIVYNILRKTADTSMINLIGDVSTVTPGDFGKASNILCNFRTSRLCKIYPNNVYGKGMVNACRAVKDAKMIGKPGEFEPPRHDFCPTDNEMV